MCTHSHLGKHLYVCYLTAICTLFYPHHQTNFDLDKAGSRSVQSVKKTIKYFSCWYKKGEKGGTYNLRSIDF